MSTGADPKTMPATAAYLSEHERIFGKKKPARGVFVSRCSACDGVQHAADARLYRCPKCGLDTYGSIDISIAPPLAEAHEARNAPVLAGRFYENTQSPIDGSDIGSRQKHREHMKRHGLTIASDYTETWKQADEKRQAIRSGAAIGQDRKARREAIERAIYSKHKP